MNDNLKQLQDKAYEILVEFDKFCNQYQLTYYLAYGTLLGAVRHEGFIPWDDDIDVLMPREDYDKLTNILFEKLPPHLSLQFFKSTERFTLNFTKITDINTTVIEKEGETSYRIGGVYIDIFPLDSVSSYQKGKKIIKKVKFLLSLICLSANKLLKKSRPLWKRIAIFLSQKLNTKKLQDKLEKTIKEKNNLENDYVVSYLGAYGEREIFKKNVFGVPYKIMFNGKLFSAPQRYDKYLSSLYGNYMELPPINKRISHHDLCYIDLKKPFSKFDLKEFKQTITI